MNEIKERVVFHSKLLPSLLEGPMLAREVRKRAERSEDSIQLLLITEGSLHSE